MNEKEDQFLKNLLLAFYTEAADHIQLILTGLIKLETSSQPEKEQQSIETIFRETHSLKGAARAVNFSLVESICQEMETIFSKWKRGQFSLSGLDVIYVAIEFIQSNLNNKTIQIKQLPEEALQIIEDLKNISSTSSSNLDVSQAATSKVSQTPAVPILNSEEKTIRLKETKLNALLLEIEELLIIKETLEQHVTYFREIHHAFTKDQNLKNIKNMFLSYIQIAQADKHSMSMLVDQVIWNLKKILMQPISSLLDFFPKIIRDLSHSQKKQVTFELQGGDIEIDRRILDEMKDPFIHLIRNCIDHGIELPEERLKQNKSKIGTISISISKSDKNQIEILLKDDGAGFKLDLIKQKALDLGLINKQETAYLSDHDIALLAFRSGISTSSKISNLSGRGMGLAIVQEKITKLGGKIDLSTSPNETVFQITLPLTMTSFRGLRIRTEEMQYILSTHVIVHIIQARPNDLKKIENLQTIVIGQKVYSFALLSDLLGLKKESNDFNYVILIQSGTLQLAVGVDEIYNEQEFLQKDLGKQLKKVPNVSSAAILSNGKVIPILDGNELIHTAIQKELFVNQPATLKTNLKKQKTILVVEDSLTARNIIKNILESAGYIVKLAFDGLEALRILNIEAVNLVLTDIEMPHLNGLELTQKIRANKKLSDLPIILCTTLGSDEDKKNGMDAGANAYVEKSNFAQSNLLDVIKKLI